VAARVVMLMLCFGGDVTRSDPHGPGIVRERNSGGFRYCDLSGAEVTNPETLHRISALGIPPAWKDVWISPDPLGHIQATGIDSRGRTQYRYHQVWREQREAQKFTHMLRFADALPALRSATATGSWAGRHLDRDRVAAAAVRLIDLGLFRIGGEKYAELDHHYGATTLRKRDVTVTAVASRSTTSPRKASAGRSASLMTPSGPSYETLISSDSTFETLFCFQSAARGGPCVLTR
jgi:DNA topoisomerase IB